MPRPDRGEADRRLSPSAQLLERRLPPMIPPSPPDDSPTPLPRPHPRRRLRVSLRGLMILVVLIGGAAGWVANTIRTQRQSIAAVRAAGGDVRFDYHKEQVGVSRGRPVYRNEPSAPRWLRRWLGDELFQQVTSVRWSKPVKLQALPATLTAVGRFGRLEQFTLGGATGVGDGFRHLRGMSRLQEVWVSGPDISDVMIDELAQIPSLRRLTIGSPLAVPNFQTADPRRSPTDVAFARLAALRDLTDLTIENCPNLTDATMARLVQALTTLRTLDLAGWPGTPAATIATLARHHPDFRWLGLTRTGVTDDELKAVEALPELWGINLRRTRVTDAGVPTSARSGT